MKKRLLILMTTVMLVCLMGVSVLAANVNKGTPQVSGITPTTMTTTYTYSFDQRNLLKNYTYGVVIPVTVTSSGYLEETTTIDVASTVKNLRVDLFANQDCTIRPEDFIIDTLSEDSLTDTDSCSLEPGIYYLRLALIDYSKSPQFTNSGKIALRFVSNADRNLANNTTTLISRKDTGTFLKIYAPQPGYVTVTGTKDTYVGLYNSNKTLLSSEYDLLDGDNDCKATFAVSKGTYYIKTTSYTDFYSVKYIFTKDPVWKAPASYVLTPADSKQSIYALFKPSKTGYITLNYNGASSANVTLCNAKKQVLSRNVSVSNNSASKTAVFAVNKNTTYYLKINSYSRSKLLFKTSFSAVNEKSGSKVSKAVSIKKGKTAEGLILPGSTTKDYYKLVVSKAQIVNVQIKGKVYSGSIKITFYADKQMKHWIGTINLYNGSFNQTYNLYTYGSKKLGKGTYYIKVERQDSKNNGYYSIKWLK